MRTNPYLNAAIAAELRSVRELHGFTAAAFARKAGLTQPRVSRLERGCVTVHLQDVLLYCRAADIRLGSFFSAVEARLTHLSKYGIKEAARA